MANFVELKGPSVIYNWLKESAWTVWKRLAPAAIFPSPIGSVFPDKIPIVCFEIIIPNGDQDQSNDSVVGNLSPGTSRNIFHFMLLATKVLSQITVAST